MAQVAIREYDAKSMFAKFANLSYRGYLIESSEDFSHFEESEKENTETKWVIKPDQLFGKRGKYGLVGVNLDIAGVQKWWQERNNTETEIKGQKGELHTFLIEPFLPHAGEYYIAIKTEREHDMIYFSEVGGIDVEENWEKIKEVKVPLSSTENREKLLGESLHIADEKIQKFLEKLYTFFVEYGFSYLEINPFVFDTLGNIVCLDMVARVDNTEAFKQKSHWGELIFPHPFGPEKTDREKYIEKLDSETGASLKFRILNPHGKIWLLTSGGGASVIIADTLGDMGFAKEIGNYGECSGNPDRENTKAYTKILLDALLEDGQSGKYLIIAGAIANFTQIDKTFSGIIDALTERKIDLQKQGVNILVRRGGINDTEGLLLMKNACLKLGLDCEIADGNTYMTEILSKIHL